MHNRIYILLLTMSLYVFSCGQAKSDQPATSIDSGPQAVIYSGAELLDIYRSPTHRWDSLQKELFPEELKAALLAFNDFVGYKNSDFVRFQKYQKDTISVYLLQGFYGDDLFVLLVNNVVQGTRVVGSRGFRAPVLWVDHHYFWVLSNESSNGSQQYYRANIVSPDLVTNDFYYCIESCATVNDSTKTEGSIVYYSFAIDNDSIIVTDTITKKFICADIPTN